MYLIVRNIKTRTCKTGYIAAKHFLYLFFFSLSMLCNAMFLIITFVTYRYIMQFLKADSRACVCVAVFLVRKSVQ